MSAQAIEYFYGRGWWARVHRAGCKDVAVENSKDGIGSGVFRSEAVSRSEAIEEVAGDFVADGGPTWREYEQHVSFAPCLSLPREVAR